MNARTVTRTLLALSLVASLLTLLPMSKASATTRYIYVNDNVASVGSPPFDGTSWAHAYSDLQTALTAADAMTPTAENPVEIRVASGTYWPGSDRETSTFLLRSNVSLLGGFNGYTDARDPQANVTVLTGELTTSDVHDNIMHVVTVDGAGASAVLDGFTVTRGHDDTTLGLGEPGCDAQACWIGGTGGGVLVNTGSPTLRNLVVVDNQAGLGGGIRVRNGSPALTNVLIAGNESALGGGMAIYGYGTTTLTNVVFVGNEATPLSAWQTGNLSSVTPKGGGLAVNYGTAILTNVLFVGNRSYNPDGWIHWAYGGGMFLEGGAATLTNATFQNNDVTAVQAAYGGGITLFGGTLTMTNSILWGNTRSAPSGDNPQIAVNGGTASVTYSDVQRDYGVYSGTGNVNGDPLFVAPGSPAGTDGRFFTADDGLQIGIGSAAVDKGNNSAVPGAVTTDLAGQPRFHDDTGTLPNATPGPVDIGAYEFQGNSDATPPTVSNVSSLSGAYNAGDVIYVAIQFSEPVNVTGTPQLALETGTIDRVAVYASGSSTSALTFNYTIQAGDSTSDLDYTDIGALTLNGGTIKDPALNNATLTLPVPAAAGSLAGTSDIVVDTTTPAVTLSTPANGSLTSDTTPTFSGTAGDAAGDGATVTVKVYSGTTATGTPVQTLDIQRAGTAYSQDAVFMSGTYTAQAEQSDAAGNVGNSAASTFAIDSIPPIVTVANLAGSGGADTTSPFAIASNSDPTITWSGDEAGTFAVKVGASCTTGTQVIGTTVGEVAGAYASGSLTFGIHTSSFAAGENTVWICLTDTTGNEGSASFVVTLDTTAPSGSVVIADGAEFTGGANVNLTLSASDGAGSGVVEMQLSNYYSSWNDWEAYAATRTWILSAGDDYKWVYVRYKDAAGNVSSSYSDRIVLDTTGPTMGIYSNPPDPSNSTSATFQWIAGEPGVGSGIVAVECKLDTGEYATCDSGYQHTYGGLAQGSHTFYVRAIDAVGNISTVDTYTWTIDSVGPAVTLTSPADGSATTDTTPTFEGTAGDATGDGATVTLKIYSGSAASGTPVRTLSIARIGTAYTQVLADADALAEGLYTAQAEQSDAAGNIAQSAAATFTIDTTAPTGSIAINDGAGFAGSTDVTLTLTGNDGSGSSVTQMQLSNDNATWPGWEAFAPTRTWTLTSGEGYKTVYVRYKDAVGNVSSIYSDEIALDMTLPVMEIIGYPPDLSNATSATFNFNGHDQGLPSGIAETQCKLDAGDYASCDSVVSHAYSGLAQGSHTFYVRAIDAVGNVGLPDTYTWTIDSVGPAVTLASPANGSVTNDTTPTFAGTAGDAAGDSTTVTVSIYSGSAASGTPARVFDITRSGTAFSQDLAEADALTEGTYTAQAAQSDAAGNTTQSAAATFTIDTTAPTGSILIAGGAEFTGSANVNLTSTASDGSGVVQMQLSNYVSGWDAWEAYAGTRSWTLAPGVDDYRWVYVRYRDAAGNISSTYSDRITLDTTAPTAMIYSNPPDPSNSTSATFQYITGEPGPGSGIVATECKLDSGEYANCDTAYQHTYSGLAQGSHTFYLRVTDAVGNIGLPDTYTWTVDSEGPAVTMTNPADGSATNDTTPTFAGTAGDATGDSTTVIVNIYSGSAASGTPIQTLSIARSGGTYSQALAAANALAEGLYTAQAAQSDAAGNTTMTTPTTFTIDTTAPTGSITVAPGADYAGSADVSLTLSATDGSGVTQMQFSNDNVTWSDWEAYATSKAWTLSAGDGNKTVYVKYKDAAGNTSVAYSDTIGLDTTLPTGTINSHPADPTNSTSAAFTFSATDPTSGGIASGVTTLECQLDGGGYAVCDSATSQSYDGLAPGSHTFYVRAVDNANNTGTPASYTWIVDTVVPVVTLTSPADGSSTNDTTPTLEGAAGNESGDGATVTLKIYGGSTASGTPIRTLSIVRSGAAYSQALADADALAEGLYTAQAEQSDAAGNSDLSAANVFRVDITAPTVTVNQATGQADPVGTAPVNFTVVFSEPVGNFASADVTLIGTAPSAAVTAVTQATPNDGTTYSVAVSGMTGDGTVIATIGAGVATDAAGNGNTASTSTDNTVTYAYLVAPAITTQPASQTVATGETATFSTEASGSPAPSVQWQVSTNDGAKWTDLRGETATTLSFAAAANKNANLYRAVFTNAAGSTASGAAMLTVTSKTAPCNTITTLTSSENPSGDGVFDLTATVTSDCGTPTGGVTFFDERTAMTTQTLVDGVATLTVSTLPTGSHTLGAQYVGNYNASSSAPLPLVVGNSADVSIGKTGIYDAASNTIIWTLTVTNLGAADATNVEVKDTLANGTRLVSVGKPGTATYTTKGRSVIVSLGTLPGGQSAIVEIITITAELTKAPATDLTVSNTASVTTTSPDGNPENNSATASVVVPAGSPAGAPEPTAETTPAQDITAAALPEAPNATKEEGKD